MQVPSDGFFSRTEMLAAPDWVILVSILVPKNGIATWMKAAADIIGAAVAMRMRRFGRNEFSHGGTRWLLH